MESGNQVRPELTSKGGFRDPALHNHDIMAAKRAADENDPTSLLPQDRLVSRDGKTLYGGYYTQDEIRDIVAYAASLGMDVIPEIDMPGHSLKIIESYPSLAAAAGPYGERISLFPCVQATMPQSGLPRMYIRKSSGSSLMAMCI